MAASQGDVVYAELDAKAGVIWPRRPIPQADGLFTVIQNGRRRYARAGGAHAAAARPADPSPAYRSAKSAERFEFTCVAFLPDGETFLAGDAGGRVFLFSVRRNEYTLLSRFPSAVRQLVPLVHQPKEALAVLEGPGAPVCVAVTDGRDVAHLHGHRLPVLSADSHARLPVCVTASEDEALLWSTEDWRQLKSLGDGAGIMQATFLGAAPGAADALCVLFRDAQILVWDLGTFSLLSRLAPPSHEPLAAPAPALERFTCGAGGDDHVLAAAASAALLLFRTRDGSLLSIAELPESARRVRHLQALPPSPGPPGGGPNAAWRETADRRRYAVLGDDGALRLLSLGALDCRVLCEAFAPPPHAITAFAAGGPPAAPSRYLVAPLSGGCLALFDLSQAVASADALRDARRRMGVPLHRAFDQLLTRVPRPHAAPDPPRPAPAPAPLREALRGAALSPAERASARRRLGALLSRHGKFPDAQRPLVWSFLLQLPRHAESHALLSSRGAEPPPRRPDPPSLAPALRSLAAWSPVLAHAPWLPSLAAPLLRATARAGDALLDFELLAALLLRWCGAWCADLPHPPAAVLSRCEDLLRARDGALADLLGGPEGWAWPLLSSGLACGLAAPAHLAIWDQILFRDDDPLLLLALPPALCLLSERRLRAAGGAKAARDLLRRPGAVDAEALWRLALSLHGEAPPTPPPHPHPTPTPTPTPLLAPHRWPLPPTAIAPLELYPHGAVEALARSDVWASEDRREVLRLERELSAAEAAAGSLRAGEAAWARREAAFLDASAARRRDRAAEASARLAELRRLDALSAAARRRRVSWLEDAARDAMALSLRRKASEAARLREEAAQLRRRAAWESGRGEAGDGGMRGLEEAALHRLEMLRARRGAEEREAQLRAQLRLREAQLAAERAARASAARAEGERRAEERERSAVKAAAELAERAHRRRERRIGEAFAGLRAEAEGAAAGERVLGSDAAEERARLEAVRAERRRRAEEEEAKARRAHRERLGRRARELEARAQRDTEAVLEALRAEEARRLAEDIGRGELDAGLGGAPPGEARDDPFTLEVERLLREA